PAMDRDDPRRDRAAADDEDEEPNPARLPDRWIQAGEAEDDEPGIGRDRVADDVLEIILDPRRDDPEHDPDDTDRRDQRALVPERQRKGRDRLVDPDERNRRERSGPPDHEERQGDAWCRVGDPGRPEVERNRPEPARDSDRERE